MAKDNNFENLNNNDNKKKDKKKTKINTWAIKITIITLFLSLIFSFVTEITASKTNIIISMLLLVLLILINIAFDGIGVAAAACALPPLVSMCAKKVPAAKIAVKLIQNAEKVTNICADVIGDICGIVSGAYAVTIIVRLVSENPYNYVFNIALSSFIAALTVGGKAFIKKIALKNSKEMILFASRVISIFYRPKDKPKVK